jgi:transposase
MDIREMLRRFQQGQSNRSIARDLSVNRKTVDRYHSWAVEQDLLEGSLPPLGDLHQLLEETLNSPPPPQNTSTVEPYRDLVVKLRKQGVEIAAIYERLKEQGYTGSYASVYRFVRQLEPRTPDVTVRVETRPGEEAQVDFGYAGKMMDPETGELRKAWAFVMTLSWSRHQYVEFVFNQKVETWLRLHRNAFAFFGGYTRNRQVSDVRRPRLDGNDCLEYALFAQRERGKAVVLPTVFPRFSMIGLHGAQAGNASHCWTSSAGLADSSDASPRAALA